jgi:hypothetical protein
VTPSPHRLPTVSPRRLSHCVSYCASHCHPHRLSHRVSYTVYPSPSLRLIRVSHCVQGAVQGACLPHRLSLAVSLSQEAERATAELSRRVDDVLGTVGFVPSSLRVRSLSGRRPPAPSQSSPFSAMYATPMDEHAGAARAHRNSVAAYP